MYRYCIGDGCSMVDNILNKIKILGYAVNELGIEDKKVYLANKSSLEYILLIPEDIDAFTPRLVSLQDIINNENYIVKVIGGGPKLNSLYSAFKFCKAHTIDLSKLNTHNVINMESMFEGTKIKNIILDGIDTSNVTSMSEMFCGIETSNLDLSSFDTRVVSDMYGMFKESIIERLDISSFNTDNVRDMQYMFAHCSVPELNLSSFSSKRLNVMYGMFLGCGTNSIDLSNFYSSNIKDINFAFKYCHGRDKECTLKSNDSTIINAFEHRRK